MPFFMQTFEQCVVEPQGQATAGKGDRALELARRPMQRARPPLASPRPRSFCRKQLLARRPFCFAAALRHRKTGGGKESALASPWIPAPRRALPTVTEVAQWRGRPFLFRPSLSRAKANALNKKIGSLEAYLDSLASVCRHEAPTEQEKQQTLREHAARFQRRRCAPSLVVYQFR